MVHLSFEDAHRHITDSRFKFTEFCDLIAEKSALKLADVMKMGRSEFLYLVAKFVSRELAQRKAEKKRQQTNGRGNSRKVSG